MNYRKVIIVIVGIFLSGLIISCSSKRRPLMLQKLDIPASIGGDELISKSYIAAKYLSDRLEKLEGVKNKLILITSFCDNDNLDTSDTLGRLIPYIISTRLSQMGYRPVDLRLKLNEIQIKHGKGEFILSRDLSKLNSKHRADMILTGHYSILYNKIYVHVEILSATNQVVISSYDFTLPLRPKMVESSSLTIIPSVKTN